MKKLNKISFATALLIAGAAAQAGTAMPLAASINGKRAEVWATEIAPGQWQIAAADVTRFGGTKTDRAVMLENVAVDLNAMTIAAELPAALMPEQTLSGGRRVGDLLKPEWGGWANYTLDAKKSGTGAIVDANLSTPYGQLRSIHTAGGEAGSGRLMTSWTKDDPERMTSLTLGDAYSSSYGGLSGFRFAGIQYRSGNYSLNPAYVYWPTASFGGTAKAASTYQLFEGNRLVGQGSVGKGDFSLQDYSSFLGASGTVKLIVRDALGNEQVVEKALYTMSGALKAGETQSAFDVGRIYQDDGTGLRGGVYASGSIRHGFKAVTLEAGFDRRAKDHSWTLGGVMPTDFGDFELRHSSGKLDGQDLKKSSVGWAKNLWQLGGGDTRVWANSESGRSTNRTAGASWWSGDLSAMVATGRADDQSTASVAVSKSWGSFSGSAFATKTGKTGTVIGLSVSMALGPNTQGWVSVSKDSSLVGGYGVLGDDYRWSAAAGSKDQTASMRKEFDRADAELYVQARKGGSSEARARVLGSVVFAGGGVALARPVSSGLLLVDTAVDGIPVRSSGRANAVAIGSKTVVTGLGAWSNGSIQPDFDALPGGYTASTDSIQLRIPRGVSSISLEVRQPGFFLSASHKGKPVERGVELTADGEPVVVSSAGAYIQPKAGQTTVRIAGGGCSAEVPVPAEALVRIEVDLCK